MPSLSLRANVFGMTEEESLDEVRYYCVNDTWWFKMQTCHYYDEEHDSDGPYEVYLGYQNWDVDFVASVPDGLVNRRQSCLYDLQWDIKSEDLSRDTRTRFVARLIRRIEKY